MTKKNLLRRGCILLISASAGWLTSCAPTVVTNYSTTNVDRNLHSAVVQVRDILKHQDENAERPVAKLLQAIENCKNDSEISGLCLLTAEGAWQRLKTRPGDKVVLDLYNAAVEKFFEINGLALARHSQNLDFPTASGKVYRVKTEEFNPPKHPGLALSYVVSSGITIKGFQQRSVVPGIGVPLVAPVLIPHDNPKYARFYPQQRSIARSMNALLIFDRKGNVTARVSDTTRNTNIVVGKTRLPLATDTTAPLAFSMQGMNDWKIGLLGLLQPLEARREGGLYLVAPFDSEKIPVLLIHGLSASPLMWRNLSAELSMDETIRKKYQFLAAYYPSGMNIPVIRRMLNQWYGDFLETFDPEGTSPASKNLIIIGHSMGGVLGRALAKDTTNQAVWDAFLKVPPDQIKIPRKQKHLITDTLIWEPLTPLDQGIYIAAPHHGSKLADSRPAQWVVTLIKMPLQLVEFPIDLMTKITPMLRSGDSLLKNATSISNLSPEYPLYPALDKSPDKPGYIYHSIIGERGSPHNPRFNDGVVPYSSAHLPGAASEFVIHANHLNIANNKNTIEEVRRILTKDKAKK